MRRALPFVFLFSACSTTPVATDGPTFEQARTSLTARERFAAIIAAAGDVITREEAKDAVWALIESETFDTPVEAAVSAALVGHELNSDAQDLLAPFAARSSKRFAVGLRVWREQSHADGAVALAELELLAQFGARVATDFKLHRGNLDQVRVVIKEEGGYGIPASRLPSAAYDLAREYLGGLGFVPDARVRDIVLALAESTSDSSERAAGAWWLLRRLEQQLYVPSQLLLRRFAEAPEETLARDVRPVKAAECLKRATTIGGTTQGSLSAEEAEAAAYALLTLCAEPAPVAALWLDDDLLRLSLSRDARERLAPLVDGGLVDRVRLSLAYLRRVSEGAPPNVEALQHVIDELATSDEGMRHATLAYLEARFVFRSDALALLHKAGAQYAFDPSGYTPRAELLREIHARMKGQVQGDEADVLLAVFRDALYNHAGWTDEEIARRLEREHIAGSGAFFSVRSTVALVDAVFEREADRIRTFRDTAPVGATITVRFREAETIGRDMKRGQTAPVDVMTGLLYLHKDELGVWVGTAYPKQF